MGDERDQEQQRDERDRQQADVPDLDVNEESGDEVKGGVPRIID